MINNKSKENIVNLLVNPNQLDALKKYVNSGGTINLKSKQPGLFYAINADNIKAIKFLLSKDIGLLEIKNGWGDFPIHEAIKNKNLKIIDAILKKDKGQITKPNSNQWQPLHIAVDQSLDDIVEYLVNKANAPIDAVYSKTSKELTAIDLAILNNYVHLEYLLDNSIFGSSENFKRLAAVIDDDPIKRMNFMIRNGLNITEKDVSGVSITDRLLKQDISIQLRSFIEQESLSQYIETNKAEISFSL